MKTSGRGTFQAKERGNKGPKAWSVQEIARRPVRLDQSKSLENKR